MGLPWRNLRRADMQYRDMENWAWDAGNEGMLVLSQSLIPIE
jgi:hypothetical protein